MAKKDARESASLRRKYLEELAVSKNCTDYASYRANKPVGQTMDKSQVGITNGDTAPDDNLNKAEILFWEDVRESGDPGLLKLYLEKYPDGIFSNLALFKMRKLESGE